jgi:tetratricopeptide (TPR) repeat protein
MTKLILVAVAFLLTKSSLADEQPKVREAMHQTFQSLMNLQPFLNAPDAFRNPKNREAIAKEVHTLADLHHAFPPGAAKQEPGQNAILQVFSSYLSDTQTALQQGNVDYARSRLRTVTGFCLSCHTRVSNSWDFEDLSHRVGSLKVSDFQKGEFYAATRQFDKALGIFRLVLDVSPKDEMGVVEYVRALRHSLSIKVRVQEDQVGTLELLDRLSRKKDLPEYVKRLIAAWKEDAVFWQTDPVPVKNFTAEALIGKARTLLGRAERRRAFPSDDNGEISYLRASGYLHEALQRVPPSRQSAEALYLLGLSYDALQEPFLWELTLLYFEACIRQAPHSEQAKQCYLHYARKSVSSYSGEGGTFVPEDEMKRLGELRRLSE